MSGRVTVAEAVTRLLPASVSQPQACALTTDQGSVRRAFAAFLNTSVSTVQKWEIGEKRPSGPSLKLLNVIDKKGVDVLV
jgi:putative transcriptional regulator